jgi:hypothetical protein
LQIPIIDGQTASKLEDGLPILFSQRCPQTLTHNDLPKTNILVHEDTLDIIGIVDWSLAKVPPFGVELYTLTLTTGYMSLDGWSNYTCREKLHNTFWEVH